MQIDSFDFPQKDLVAIVAELAKQYCGYEHPSVTYEKAQMLMEAV